jgi:hypothetical protein
MPPVVALTRPFSSAAVLKTLHTPFVFFSLRILLLTLVSSQNSDEPESQFVAFARRLTLALLLLHDDKQIQR